MWRTTVVKNLLVATAGKFYDAQNFCPIGSLGAGRCPAVLAVHGGAGGAGGPQTFDWGFAPGVVFVLCFIGFYIFFL